MLLDAPYVDKIAGDLSKHFGEALGRKLPEADLSVLLECLSLDGGVTVGENAIQVCFICDEKGQKMAACRPSDLENEWNNMAFRSSLGEYALYVFEPSGMASREDLFVESLRLLADAAEVKRLIVVPAGEEYGDKLPPILNKVSGKKAVTVFSMNPPAEEVSYQWEMPGFAVLKSLGIKAEEL